MALPSDPAPATISGSVRLPDGSPITNRCVYLSRAGGSDIGETQTTADGGFDFAFDFVNSASRLVFVSSDDCNAADGVDSCMERDGPAFPISIEPGDVIDDIDVIVGGDQSSSPCNPTTAAAADVDMNYDGLGDLLVGSSPEDADTATTIYGFEFGYDSWVEGRRLNRSLFDYPDSFELGAMASLGPGVQLFGVLDLYEDSGVVDYTTRRPQEPLIFQRTDGRYRGEPGDRFGAALAAGDFNGDGTNEFLAGAPGEDLGTVVDAGDVSWHSTVESSADTRAFRQGTTLIGAREAGDRLGAALAVGDFDGDGYDDAAIGVPGEDVGTVIDAGAVNISYGGPDGLGRDRAAFSQSGSVRGILEEGDGFGTTLAVGDFDGDGFDDLAVGSPGEDITSFVDGGTMNLLYGSSEGLRKDRNVAFSQERLRGTSEADDRFGSALAVGDLNGDGYDDLAIGVPGEDIGDVVDAGAVNVIFGSDLGLVLDGNEILTQLGPLAGSSEAEDALGSAVAIGPLNWDRFDDLAIGVPGEDIGDVVDAGVVAFVPGSPTGIDITDDMVLRRYYPATRNEPIPGERFGSSLLAG